MHNFRALHKNCAGAKTPCKSYALLQFWGLAHKLVHKKCEEAWQVVQNCQNISFFRQMPKVAGCLLLQIVATNCFYQAATEMHGVDFDGLWEKLVAVSA